MQLLRSDWRYLQGPIGKVRVQFELSNHDGFVLRKR